MLRTFAKVDAAIAYTRPAWAWTGQLALIALGIHLGADRIDDELGAWLANLGIAWPDPQSPVTLGTYGALGIELSILGIATRSLLKSSRAPVASWRDPRRRSPTPWVLPIFWAPNALGGSWVVGMATEDLLAPWLADGATLVGWCVFMLVLSQLF